MTLGGAESTLFWVAAPLAVLGALGLLFARKAVHAAMGMALTMIVMGVFYIAQQAEFLGVIQIFVYSGAVMMLFLFVVMLIGVDTTDSLVETIRGQRTAGLLLVLALAAMGLALVGRADLVKNPRPSSPSVVGVAESIFGPYVWTFEATSALLITAALAAMMLAHRERLTPKAGQAEWSRRRVSSGRYVAGLPAPGVYARHNAVDTPALLPDGTPSELSVSRVLRAREQVLPTSELTEATHEIDHDTGWEPEGTPVATDDGEGARR